VKIPETVLRRHFDSPPDLRLEVQELDPDPKSGPVFHFPSRMLAARLTVPAVQYAFIPI